MRPPQLDLVGDEGPHLGESGFCHEVPGGAPFPHAQPAARNGPGGRSRCGGGRLESSCCISARGCGRQAHPLRPGLQAAIGGGGAADEAERSRMDCDSRGRGRRGLRGAFPGVSLPHVQGAADPRAAPTPPAVPQCNGQHWQQPGEVVPQPWSHKPHSSRDASLPRPHHGGGSAHQGRPRSRPPVPYLEADSRSWHHGCRSRGHRLRDVPRGRCPPVYRAGGGDGGDLLLSVLRDLHGPGAGWEASRAGGRRGGRDRDMGAARGVQRAGGAVQDERELGAAQGDHGRARGGGPIEVPPNLHPEGARGAGVRAAGRRRGLP
mmetsp:Transcript_38592/g.122318  ORF Transcript_38592/g.122318 Transcript_38592/m.122318 type:complete len:320 (+) Transcript_38592:6397-7356(+)